MSNKAYPNLDPLELEDRMHRCANAIEVAACVVVSVVEGHEEPLTRNQRNTLLFAVYEAQDRAAELREMFSAKANSGLQEAPR